MADGEELVTPIRTVHGRKCDLVDTAFLVAKMGYTLDALKVSNTCQAANNDAQLMGTLANAVPYNRTCTVLEIIGYIGSVDRVAHLIKQGGNIAIERKYSNADGIAATLTLLTRACEKGNVELVRFLLERGLSPNVFTHFRKYPSPRYLLSLVYEEMTSKLFTTDEKRETFRQIFDMLVAHGAMMSNWA